MDNRPCRGVRNTAVVLTVVACAVWAHSSALAQEKRIDLADLGVSFVPPKGFSTWNKEMILKKYPNRNPPKYVYAGDERGRVSIAVTTMPAPAELDDDFAKLRELLEKTFRKSHPDAKWIKRDYATLNGTRWVHLSLETQAIDTRIQNDLYATFKGKDIVAFNFNCIVELNDPQMAKTLEACATSIKLLTPSVTRQTPVIKPVTVEAWDIPRQTKVDEEFTVKVTIKTTLPRLTLLSVRLYCSDNCQLLAPGSEQTLFIEPGTSTGVFWRLRQTGAGQSRFSLESYVVADKLGSGSPIPSADKAALEKEWNGTFSDPDSTYLAKAHLRVFEEGGVEGKIRWTLKHATREDYQGKFGNSGTEFVWGSYDAKSRVLVLRGYRRDDPTRILGLDKYTLTLDDAGGKLIGTTWNHGKQDGRFELTASDRTNK
jgi:hypothetical protein